MNISRGTVSKRTWKYCDTHQTMLGKTCVAAGCKGRNREAYEYCFTYYIDGKKQRARGQAPSKGEAEQAMEKRKADLVKEPEPIAPPVVTLNEYADTWLANIATSIEKRTLQSYAGMLKNHIRPTLGALALNAVTRANVKDLLAAKRQSGLSKDSVRLVRATLSALYADAMDREIVAANPAVRTGRARGRRTPDSVSTTERRQKIRVMSVDQLDTFLRFATTNGHPALWLFLADTGVRPGEAFALRWTDVDLVARQANIERAVERGGKIKATKTGEARAVDLTPRLVAALDQLQTNSEADALASGREVSELVFPSEAGTPLDDVNIARRFKALLVKAGLPKFRLYDLRHTFASHLLAMNAPLMDVSHQLGHAKATTTLTFYAHFMPRGNHSLANQLESWRAAAPATAKKVRV
jgi:integrase